MPENHYRKQAEALYALARVTSDATERLGHILRAIELEARASETEQGQPLPRPNDGNCGEDREPTS